VVTEMRAYLREKAPHNDMLPSQAKLYAEGRLDLRYALQVTPHPCTGLPSESASCGWPDLMISFFFSSDRVVSWAYSKVFHVTSPDRFSEFEVSLKLCTRTA
jgi:hypothetical protein